ncbi:dethiobiotin synthase [Methylosoma difficile]
MNQSYFITGTDTNVGKTWATIALMRAWQQQGRSVLGMKPVASGCTYADGELKNDDALLIQAHASLPLAYRQINPFAYVEAVSPHIAGTHNPADFAVIRRQFDELKAQADVLLVEGAGGWYSPMNAQQSNADLAVALALPVILVVAMRLGCINHALLSQQAIQQSGLPLVGWIAVCSQADMAYLDGNIATLKSGLATPLLGVLPYLENADFSHLTKHLDLSYLKGD